MTVEIMVGDARELLAQMAPESVHCAITSPPYFGLRDYENERQIGREPSPDAYVAALVETFAQLRRVLRPDGTLWVNLGDSYARRGGTDRAASKSARVGNSRKTIEQAGDRDQRPPEGVPEKSLIGIPWRVALALQADGWYLRQDIIWHKPNAMPESISDRCTTAHEYLFMLSRGPRYYFDAASIAEPCTKTGTPGHLAGGRGARAGTREGLRGLAPRSGMRNKRSVWTVPTEPFAGGHFAVYPAALISPCILASCPEGGVVLDPFGGAGTTGLAADRLGRNAILIELNPEYAALARSRLKKRHVAVSADLAEVASAGPLFGGDA